MIFKKLLDEFVKENIRILGKNLTGIYLHGSAVMGCFNPEKSDLDLLIVVNETVPDDVKKEYMDMVIRLNAEAPAKGLELSLLKRADLDPFIYPTPFELHFSVTHLSWYRTSPEDYIRKMKGTDKDLAAHVTVLRHRGTALYGAPVQEVFGDVRKEDYFDSIFYDIENAADDIHEDPVYIILNLARVLAFGQEDLILSKKEGGTWGLANLPARFHPLLSAALAAYSDSSRPADESDPAAELTDRPAFDRQLTSEYAAYMLGELKSL